MTDRAWRFLLFGYLAPYLIAIGLEVHYRHPASMTPLAMMLTAPIVLGFAAHGVQFGYVRGRFSRVEREDSPVTFWINIGFYVAFGLGMFCWGLRDAFK
jgi:hypothetical protein